MIVRDPEHPYESQLPEGLRTDLGRSGDAEHLATFDPVLVERMLDVIDAAERVLLPDWQDRDALAIAEGALVDALARFREVAG